MNVFLTYQHLVLFEYTIQYLDGGVHVTGYAYMDRNGTTRWGTVVCDMDDYVIECWLRWTSGTSYMVYVSLNYNGFHAGQTEVDIFE